MCLPYLFHIRPVDHNYYFNHRYYTNNTGLEAPLCGPALLTVLEIINYTRCTALLPCLLALFIEDRKLTDSSEAVNKASRRKDLYLPPLFSIILHA